MSVRILLAEDHVLVRQGLRALLEKAEMAVIGEASDGQETLCLAQAHQPDVTVLDIAMPHLNGLETARRLREIVPQTKIIVLTMHHEEMYILEALKAGAVGYVLKTQAAVDVVQAIHAALQGAIRKQQSCLHKEHLVIRPALRDKCLFLFHPPGLGANWVQRWPRVGVTSLDLFRRIRWEKSHGLARKTRQEVPHQVPSCGPQ